MAAALRHISHSILLALKGIAPPKMSVDLGDLSLGVQARIVNLSDPALELFDRRGAFAQMLGTGGVLESDSSFRDRFAKASRVVRESRARESNGRALLLLSKQDKLSTFKPKTIIDCKSFSVCLDDWHEATAGKLSSREVSAVIGAMHATHANLIGVDAMGSALIVQRDDGAPIYWYNIVGSRASLCVSTLFALEQVESIKTYFQAFVLDGSLERVMRLLQLSLEQDRDPLRSFFAGWNALEIFIGKVFRSYELDVRFMLETQAAGLSPTERARLQVLVKDKYSLADRFAVVATMLNPATADDNVAVFRTAKRARDHLSHGQDIDEHLLPITSIQDLIRQYLALYTARRVAPT